MDVLRCQCRRCFSSTVAVAYKRFSLTYKQTKKCSQTKHSKKNKNNQPNKNFFLLETEQKRSPAKLKFSRPQKNTKKIVRRCYCCTNNKTNKPVPPQKKWRTEKQQQITKAKTRVSIRCRRDVWVSWCVCLDGAEARGIPTFEHHNSLSVVLVVVVSSGHLARNSIQEFATKKQQQSRECNAICL